MASQGSHLTDQVTAARRDLASFALVQRMQDAPEELRRWALTRAQAKKYELALTLADLPQTRTHEVGAARRVVSHRRSTTRWRPYSMQRAPHGPIDRPAAVTPPLAPPAGDGGRP